VIGWAGVDGIHYCFVRGFGEMVFAVSPMNTTGNYVHPVARDFMDFLRLLLVCGDVVVLEQVYCWDQAQFDAFLQDNLLTAKQQAVLECIREKLLLAPMEQPFAYIKELQAGFDYSRIKYTRDYYELVPVEPKMTEWKVYFDGNFWGYHGRERAGKEISLNKQFIWDDEVWHILSIYSCSKGLVVDFCVQVPAERIRSFTEKWKLSIENNRIDVNDEQRMQMDAENPLTVNINPKVALNEAILSRSHGCSMSWNPSFLEGSGLAAEGVTQHYGLDPAYGWVILRAAFPWSKKRKPQITTLRAILMQEPVAMPGPHFQVSVPGERIEFTHPTTGTLHTLTVKEYKRGKMSREHFNSQNQEFPTHHIAMTYTLSPDLPGSAFNVTDCVRSDKPRQKPINPIGPQVYNSVCACIIGSADGPTATTIIGGAYGPTAIIIGQSGQDKHHIAYSALHFEAVEDVEWRMMFHEKRHKDVTVELI
jgi:hypothetical protein